MDQIDYQIVKLLKENSRIQWKEIGDTIHMTGQAVGNRIRRMEDEGIIEKYTIVVNELKVGNAIQAFITVIMKTNNHTAFQQYLRSNPYIVEAHRVSGDGCYFLKASIPTQEALSTTLDEILKYANYRVNLSIGKIL
jgi:Lrp/AsnC family transcriptional regulator, leucine-responsive regulatory protein